MTQTETKPDTLSFLNHLRTQVSAQGKREPDELGYRLLMSGCEILVEAGYANIRVGETASRAGVSRATFYNHFKNKLELCEAIFREYSNYTYSLVPRSQDATHPFSVLVSLNMLYARYLSENAEIHRNFLALSGEFETIAEIWHNYVSALTNVLSEVLSEAYGGLGQLDRHVDSWIVGSMLHENVNALYISGRSNGARQFIASPEHLAVRAAVLTYRAIFLEDPPSAVLQEANEKALSGIVKGTEIDT